MSRPSTLPGGVGSQPGIGNVPGIGNRPGVDNQPSIGNRPGIGNNTGIANRPNFGDLNTNINNRPSWVNINNNQINNIHTNWGNAFGRPGVGTLPANRAAYWNGRGAPIRNNWWNGYRAAGWFGAGWWAGHNHAWCGWHYHYGLGRYPYNYWWTVPVWGAVNRWWAWGTYPQDNWSQPVYYDYSDGGNVTYENNNVYIGGEQIASADEYAQSAAALATVAPPTDEATAEAAEWMPLGTFAVIGNEQETDPSRIIQLAVNKEGVISGTLYNKQTDEAQGVQGQVDKETQRAAFRLANSDTIVIETGIYNLTQEEASVLVHFGTDRTENWLLVRLENPEGEDDSATPATPATPAQ